MTKSCLSCNTKFDGRRDAKTCSTACRKRLQRAKAVILYEAGVLKKDAQQVMDTLKGDIIPVKLAAEAVLARAKNEAGFITVTDSQQPQANSLWKPNYLDSPSASASSTQNLMPSANSSPAAVAVAVAPEPTPVSVPAPPPTPTATSVPEPPAIVQPTILSLEDSPAVSEAAPTFLSSLAASGTVEPSSISQVPLSQSDSATTPLPGGVTKESLKSKLRSWLRNTPRTASLSALVVLVLVGGAFGGAKLTRQSTPVATVVNSQSNGVVNQGDNILNINLNTVLASGKKLTLGQIVAGPDSSILQITGDVQSSGTLLASGGGSSLNNTGLKINNVVVCTDAGCRTGATRTLASTLTGLVNIFNLPAEVTIQGNSFNSPSQLVQLTGAGLLPSLSGINLTNLNGSNIASGTVGDSRLSGNVSLLGPTIESSEISDGTIVNADLSSSAAIAYSKLSLAGSIVTGDITDGTITNADISATAGIIDSKLATISTAGKVSDTALSSNVALLNGTGPQTFTGNNKFSGTFLSQNASNSTTAFQIQNAAGSTTVLNADTTNGRLGVGLTNPGYAVDVNGDVNLQAGNIYRIGGTAICTSGGCAALAGSGSYIQNSATVQAGANINIESASISSVAAVIKGKSGQTSDLFQLQNGAGANVATFGATGDILYKPSTDSTTAFQVQNSAGNSVLLVDTSGNKVTLGKASTLTANVSLYHASGAGSIALSQANPGASSFTITVPAETGTLCSTAASAACTAVYAPATGSGSYANAALSNLASVAINTALLPGGDNTIDLGDSTTKSFRTAYFDTSVLSPAVDVISAGTLSLGTTTATGVTIGGTTNTTSLALQGAAGATYTIGNTNTTGVITLGQSTATNTISIGSGAVADTKTQTISIANGNAVGGTSGGVVLNLAAGTPGSNSTNTIHLGDGGTTTGTVAVTVGSSDAAAHTTVIQGGNGTGSSAGLKLQTAAAGDINIGGTAHTGAIVLGQSTAGETINIGNGNVASGNTNTINIGATATSTGKDVITIGSTVAASSLLLQAGTGNVQLQSQGGTLGVGNNSVAQTLTIGNGTGATAVSILCGTGTCGIGNNATDHSTTVGSSTGTSATVLQGGTGAVSLLSGGNITLGTSDATGTLLVLDTDTDANIASGSAASAPAEVDGGMFYSTTNRSFFCGVNGVWVACIGGLLSSNTANSSAIANTASETNFSLTYSMPANYCVAGRVIRWTAQGVYSSTLNPTVTIAVKAGSSQLHNAQDFTTNNASNLSWRVQAQTICQAAPGASVSTSTEGLLIMGTGTSTASLVPFIGASTTNLATNGALTLQISAQWSAASANNTITMTQFIIEGIGP